MSEEGEDGAVVRRYTWFRYDVETQLEYVEFRYEVTLDARRSKRRTSVFSPETRSYTQEQAIDLYTAAGFGQVRVSKGFERDRASEDDKLFTVIGVK